MFSESPPRSPTRNHARADQPDLPTIQPSASWRRRPTLGLCGRHRMRTGFTPEDWWTTTSLTAEAMRARVSRFRHLADDRPRGRRETVKGNGRSNGGNHSRPTYSPRSRAGFRPNGSLSLSRTSRECKAHGESVTRYSDVVRDSEPSTSTGQCQEHDLTECHRFP